MSGRLYNGGGQPFVQSEEREKRGKGLYSADKLCNIKSSEENPLMMTLYKGILRAGFMNFFMLIMLQKRRQSSMLEIKICVGSSCH